MIDEWLGFAVLALLLIGAAWLFLRMLFEHNQGESEV